jgi:anthranilate phosphoribosyltransferase
MSDPSTLSDLLRNAVDRPLTAHEAEAAFSEIMEGRATPVQMATLLVAIRARGPVPDEVAGGVRALRRAMVPVPVRTSADLVDTCGTGGGALTTFNISTAAAFTAAGAGVRIAKHGNRSFSSRSGSADVLESLGIRLELSPEQEARALEEAGIVFMFAPLHHPAMRHIAPVRRELAMPTLMNILGPLTNPAAARRQVVGVSDPALIDLIAGALRVLGHERALVVHGEPGLDELSPLGPTQIAELRNGDIRRWIFDPEQELGWSAFEPRELAGGSPEENAHIVERVLKGELGGAARAAVVLNGAAAIYVAGQVESLLEALPRAETALDSGAAWDRLQALRGATRSGR